MTFYSNGILSQNDNGQWGKHMKRKSDDVSYLCDMMMTMEEKKKLSNPDMKSQCILY